MTRSIFDPTGGETEHSGSRYMGPRADNISHMPPDVVDGEVSDEEVAEQAALDAQQEESVSVDKPRQQIPPELKPGEVEQSKMPSAQAD